MTLGTLRSLVTLTAVVVLGFAGVADARKPSGEDLSGKLEHVTVNGCSLAYLDSGKGEPVVLVHGAASDYRIWAGDVAPLAREFRVIDYSRRYHFPNQGGGDGRDYSMKLHVHDLKGLIDALHLGRVRLVGHGDGAEIAARFAVLHPQQVQSLVLVEPSFPELMKGDAKESEFKADRSLWMEQMRMTLRDDFARLSLAHLVEWNYGPTGLENLPRLIGQRMADDVDALKKQYLSPVTDTPFGPEQVAKLGCPVLYVVGEKSPWHAHAMAKAFAAALPGTKCVTLKGETHGMVWSDPRDFTRACLEFLGHEQVAGE